MNIFSVIKDVSNHQYSMYVVQEGNRIQGNVFEGENRIKEVIFRDVSNSESKIKLSYVVEFVFNMMLSNHINRCEHCGINKFVDRYDGEKRLCVECLEDTRTKLILEDLTRSRKESLMQFVKEYRVNADKFTFFAFEDKEQASKYYKHEISEVIDQFGDETDYKMQEVVFELKNGYFTPGLLFGCVFPHKIKFVDYISTVKLNGKLSFLPSHIIEGVGKSLPITNIYGLPEDIVADVSLILSSKEKEKK